MQGKVTRVAKPRRVQTQAAAATTSAEEAPAPTPTETQPAAAPEPQGAVQKREKAAKPGGVLVPVARVRRCLDEHGLNREVSKVMESIAPTPVPATEGAPAANPELDAKISALKSASVRFGSEVPIIVSIVSEEIVRDLATFAMENATKSKKRMLSVNDIYADGLKERKSYKLIRNLPVVMESFNQCFKERHDGLIADLKKTVAKETESSLRKKYKGKIPRKRADEPVEPPAAVSVAENPQPGLEPEPEPEKPVQAVRFTSAVGDICSRLRVGEYACVKFGNKFCLHLSEVIFQFIHRITSLIYTCIDLGKVKTVKNKTLLHCIEWLLNDGCGFTETVELILNDSAYKAVRRATFAGSYYPELSGIITDKLAKYHADMLSHAKKETPSETQAHAAEQGNA